MENLWKHPSRSKDSKVSMADFDGSIIWDEALERARKDIPEQEFLMWFRLGYFSFDGNVLTVSAPNAFLRDQFNRKYHGFMKTMIRDLTALDIDLDVSVKKNPNPAVLLKQEGPVPGEAKEAFLAPPPLAQAASIVQMRVSQARIQGIRVEDRKPHPHLRPAYPCDTGAGGDPPPRRSKKRGKADRKSVV